MAQKRDRQLEKDYVINLQQQVYFLELELNLLKKASVPKAVGGLGIDVLPDGPLESVILALREKYDKMEAEYKHKLSELQDRYVRACVRATRLRIVLDNVSSILFCY